MTSRPRHLTLLFSLVAVLLAVALPSLAHASPDGDDDTTYNAGSAFGTRYSSLELGQSRYLPGAKPVTDQDAADGSSVTATLLYTESKVDFYSLRLTRFGLDGLPSGFETTEVSLPSRTDYSELLDLRVLADRSFVVLIRGFEDDESGDQTLFLRRYDANGDEVPDSAREYALPADCVPILTRGEGDEEIVGYVKAARATASGGAFALWDCAYEDYNDSDRSTRGLSGDPFGTYVTRYAGEASGLSTNEVELTNVDYGLDLEFGPTGDPYALTGTYAARGRLASYRGTSTVFHVKADDLSIVNRSTDVLGLPVDLAVDSQARPVVWTEAAGVPERGGSATWHIWRLTAPSMSAIDTSWGSDGQSVVSDPRLGYAYGPEGGDTDRSEFLTVRPDDKVLASGRARGTKMRSAGASGNGIIAGLTSGGQTDTGFATNGFKPFEYAAPGEFDRIGEATLQSDGKVLIPHQSYRDPDVPKRIADPPSVGAFVGVTRLVGPSATVTSTVPATSSPVRPSATPTICGRRAISLVRADVKGNKVKLTGLVGAALYGKRVTIQTDPKGARNSKFTKTGTVTASRTTGAFTATVPKPKAEDFISIRYRAVSGSAKSPSLKLPQRLTSRSVKSATNTITLKGKVKKSVLGKRNKVLIRRLVCGRYRTVGSARPDADGNYTVTFASTQIRGVAFYRAESKVLRKPGSKKYVIQYARAIAIRTTSQTG